MYSILIEQFELMSVISWINTLFDQTYMMLPLDKTIDTTVKEVAREYTLEPSESQSIRKGVFIIHGIASTPQVFTKYAERIKNEGYYVCICRIAGHGTSPSHLAVTTIEDWYESVDRQMEEFIHNYEISQIVIAGHSLGALLAATLVSRYQSSINIPAAMFFSTPILPKATFMHLFYRLIPLIEKIVKYIPVPPEKLRVIREERGAIVYHKHPVALFYQVSRLIKRIIPRLHYITSPTLLVIGGEDEFVHRDSHDVLIKGMSSEIIEEYVAPGASHALIDTSDLESFENLMMDFIIRFN